MFLLTRFHNQRVVENERICSAATCATYVQHGRSWKYEWNIVWDIRKMTNDVRHVICDISNVCLMWCMWYVVWRGKGAQLTPSQQLECHPLQLLLSRSRNRQHLGNGETARRNSTCVETACGLLRQPLQVDLCWFKLQDAAGISKVHRLGANRVANFDALSCVDIPNTSFRLSRRRRPSESGHCLKVLPFPETRISTHGQKAQDISRLMQNCSFDASMLETNATRSDRLCKQMYYYSVHIDCTQTWAIKARMTRFSEFDHLDQINIQSIPMKGIAYVQLAFMKWLVQSYQMPRHVASTHLPTKWIKVVFCLLLVDWVDHTWQKCSPFVSQARERMVSVLCQLAEERIVEFMDGGLRINTVGLRWST